MITGALVSGAIADRARFGAWMVFVGWSLVVYAPIAHWIFDFSDGDHVGGWMANKLEVIDFAGGPRSRSTPAPPRSRWPWCWDAAWASARSRCGRTT